jgi:hypothetical protein
MNVVQIISALCLVAFFATIVITLTALTGLLKLGGGSKEDHRYYLRRLFHALILEVVIIGVAAFSATVKDNLKGTSVVPPTATVKTKELPPEVDAGFMLLRDISVWDLRGWVTVPTERMMDRISPAHYLNYIHVKKVSAQAIYTVHYWTGGSAIDLRCITHNAKIYEKTSADIHSQPGHEYAIEIDVTAAPLNEEFLIVIEGTYWNAFQMDKESAETYTDADIGALGELGLIVLFPLDKPFKEAPELNEIDSNTQQERKIRENTSFYADKKGQFLYWDVTSRRPNKHYKVSWSW